MTVDHFVLLKLVSLTARIKGVSQLHGNQWVVTWSIRVLLKYCFKAVPSK